MGYILIHDDIEKLGYRPMSSNVAGWEIQKSVEVSFAKSRKKNIELSKDFFKHDLFACRMIDDTCGKMICVWYFLRGDSKCFKEVSRHLSFQALLTFTSLKFSGTRASWPLGLHACAKILALSC